MKTNYATLSRTVGTVTALALILGASGCATSQPPRSGYLPDYATLQPVNEGGDFLATILEPAMTARPITVAGLTLSARPGHADSLPSAQQTEFLRLAQAEWAKAFLALAPGETAGPALELRATLSAVNLSNPSLNVVSTLALLLPFDNGGVGIEWQLVEPATGRVCARGVAAYAGRPWQFTAHFRETGHALIGVKIIAQRVAAYIGRTGRGGEGKR
jgi:hypothetical protein